jgi:hypothetical protein
MLTLARAQGDTLERAASEEQVKCVVNCALELSVAYTLTH